MSLRLSGYNPLAYQGVEPLQPPQFILAGRAPTITDREYNIGSIWLVEGTANVFMLVTLIGGVAIWVSFTGTVGASIFPCNIGTATAAAGILQVLGAIGITTTGSGNTITISTDGSSVEDFIANIGSAAPAGGVINMLGGVQFNTAGSGHTVTIKLNRGNDGQILIGSSSGHPVWADITSSTLTITPGPNSIDITAPGFGVTQTYHTDSGDAIPVAGVLNLFGGSNMNTTSPSAHTVDINLNNTVSISGSWNAGTTVTAGTGLIVNSGGIDSTGTTTLHSLGAGVMQTDATGLVSSTDGTDGQLLIGGGSNAQWNSVTSSDGSVTIIPGHNTLDLEVAGVVAAIPFLAVQPSNLTSAFGSQYKLGTSTALTEIFDLGGALFPGDGAGSPAVFTAPSTGKYFFIIAIQLVNGNFGGTGHVFITLRLITTARTYEKTDRFTTTLIGAGGGSLSVYGEFSTMADMTAGDTAQFAFQLSTTNVTSYDLYGNGSTDIRTYIAGRFVG